MKRLIYTFLILLCTATAYAAPPLQPMVIHGEVLAEGKEVAEGTELRVSVKGQETVLKTTKSPEGISLYSLKVYAYNPNKPEKPGEVRAKEGDEIRFLSLGKYTLADMAAVKWKQGMIVKKDIVISQPIQKAPTIITASAVQKAEKWVLSCSIRPVMQDKLDNSLIAYKVRWFYKRTKEVDGKKVDETVFLKEETMKDLKGDKDSDLYYEGQLNELKHFVVVVTPEMLQGGSKGPSVMKNVFPVLTQGGI